MSKNHFCTKFALHFATLATYRCKDNSFQKKKGQQNEKRKQLFCETNGKYYFCVLKF